MTPPARSTLIAIALVLTAYGIVWALAYAYRGAPL